MSHSHSPVPRTLALRWTILSALGLSGGIALALAVSGPVEAVVGMMLVTPVILGLAGGILGTSQSIAVGLGPRGSAIWIAAGTIALAVGMTGGIVAVETVGRALTGESMRLATGDPLARWLSLVAIGGTTGLAVGVAHRFALRILDLDPHRSLRRSILAFAIGFPVGGQIGAMLPGGLGELAGFATFLAVTGSIVGLATVRVAAGVADQLRARRATG